MKVSKLAVLLSVVVVSAIGLTGPPVSSLASVAVSASGFRASRSLQATTLALQSADKDVNLTTLSKLLTGEGVRVESSLVNQDSHAYRELKVRWQSSSSAAQDGMLKQAGPGAVTLLVSAKKEGKLPRDRALELSPNQILLIAVDPNGKLRWWKLLLDPRLIRAEVPEATGELKGEDYYLKTVDFMIPYPDEAGITEVRLYHPHWTGKEFQLELISRLAVN